MKYNLKEMAEFNNYKKMEYQPERIEEILMKGTFKNYKFYILNLGTHPTAYIEIPRTSKLFGKGYNEIYEMGIDIDVHGGLTYSSSKLLSSENSWFIGWDCSHCYDYSGYEVQMPSSIRTGGKKWTTEEIFDEVCCAIDKLVEIDTINKTKYDEIVNGYFTYKAIVRDLKINKSVILGWTDNDSTHLDIYISLNNTNKYGYLQRGIKETDLFIGIIDHSFYGFKTECTKDESYICEKLRMGQSILTKRLTELINGIIIELNRSEEDENI